MNFLELLKYSYESRNISNNSNTINILNDSIIQYSNNCLKIQELTIINDSHQNIDWRFEKTEYCPITSEALLFEVVINDSNGIIAEGNPATISDLKRLADGYIFSDSAINNAQTSMIIESKYFGKYKTSKIISQITIYVDKKNGLSSNTWKTLFKVLSELKTVTNKKKNELSIRKWGKNFNSLSFDKRIDVSQIIGSRISIVFVPIVPLN